MGWSPRPSSALSVTRACARMQGKVHTRVWGGVGEDPGTCHCALTQGGDRSRSSTSWALSQFLVPTVPGLRAGAGAAPSPSFPPVTRPLWPHLLQGPHPQRLLVPDALGPSSSFPVSPASCFRPSPTSWNPVWSCPFTLMRGTGTLALRFMGCKPDGRGPRVAAVSPGGGGGARSAGVGLSDTAPACGLPSPAPTGPHPRGRLPLSRCCVRHMPVMRVQVKLCHVGERVSVMRPVLSGTLAGAAWHRGGRHCPVVVSCSRDHVL